MKKFNQKGITIISLVITVIVLAILAVSVIVNTVGIDGIANRTASSRESYQVKEDREIIEISKQEIAQLKSGDIPKDDIKEKLRETRFTPIEDIDSYEELKCIKLEEDDFIVKCTEHYEHYYKVTPDETIYLGSLKDIPIITIGSIDINSIEIIIPVTVKCENGIKNITLPNGTKIDAKDYTNLDNGKARTEGGKYTEITFNYSVSQIGTSYTFKATSLLNTTSRKIVSIGNEGIEIEVDPTWTNKTVYATVINGSSNTQIKIINWKTGTTIKNWHTATEYTENENYPKIPIEQNCIIIAKEQTDNELLNKVKGIQNIDRLAPDDKDVEITTPEKTIDSFKLKIVAKDHKATDYDGKSGIKEVKWYITQEGTIVKQGRFEVIPDEQEFDQTVDDIVGLKVGTTYGYYVEVTDYAGNTYSTKNNPGEVTTLHQYNITYYGNDGTTADGKDSYIDIKTEGTGIPIQNYKLFSRTGYRLVGWKDKNGTGTYSEGETYTDNKKLDLNAIWEPNTYTVAYNANGGTVTPTSTTANYNSSITLPTPERKYTVKYNSNGGSNCADQVATYTFNGWYTAVTGGTKRTYTKMPAYNETLYAQWTSASITLPTPTRTGYTFGGWYKEESLTNKVGDAGESYTPTANITLYAKWNINSYTVTYDYATNGGSSATKTTATVNYNSAIDLTPTASKSGYTFVGWNTNKDATTAISSLTMGTSDVTLYAIYSKTITLTFIDYNGTTKTTNTPKITIYNNGKGTYTAPAINTYTGWTSRYWTTGTGSTSGQTVASGGNITNISANTTYYARYYQGVTGTFIDYNGTTKTTRTVSGNRETNSYAIGTITNATITSPAINTYTGWTTRYWTTGTGATSGQTVASGGSISNISANTTYYARYYQEITISFNANGGSGTAPTPLKGNRETNSYAIGTISNPSVTMPTNPFSKTGYSFGGWNENTSGTGTNYAAGTSYTFTSSKTLYVKWRANQYPVTFDANGGSVSPTSQTVTYASTYGTLPTPTRTGYTFVGWYTSTYKDHPLYYYADTYVDLKNAFGYNETSLYNHWINTGKNEGRRVASYLATDTVTTAGNITMYAGWVANNYTLTVNHYLENANDSNYSYATTTYATLPYGTGINYASYATSVANGTYSRGSGPTTMGTGTTISLYYTRVSLPTITYTLLSNLQCEVVQHSDTYGTISKLRQGNATFTIYVDDFGRGLNTNNSRISCNKSSTGITYYSWQINGSGKNYLVININSSTAYGQYDFTVTAINNRGEQSQKTITINIFNENQRFLDDEYKLAFNRTIDESGQSSWMGVLTNNGNGGYNPNEVIRGIMGSGEMNTHINNLVNEQYRDGIYYGNTNRAAVYYIYKVALGRPPESDTAVSEWATRVADNGIIGALNIMFTVGEYTNRIDTYQFGN